jgi:CHASE1-domain containing sensor protein
MNILYLLLFCATYRPLLILLIGLLLLIAVAVWAVARRRSRSRRKFADSAYRLQAEYASRFDDVQRSAYDRRHEAANSFVEDVNNILGR